MSVVGILLWLSASFVETATADTTYFDKKMQQIMTVHLLSEENFYVTAIPITDQYVIASQYKQWVARGYQEEEMMNLSREAVSQIQGKLYFLLRAGLSGGISPTGRQSVVLPANLEDFVWIVTDKGDTLHCEKAEVPFARAVSLLNPEVEATLIFPTTIKKGGLERDVLHEATSIEFVMKGLGFKKDRIRYRLPLNRLFEDAPAPLQRLFRLCLSKER